MDKFRAVGSPSEDELENDLPSIASGAAVALDHLIRKKTFDPSPLRRLLSHIHDLATAVPGPVAHAISPSALVAIHGAIIDSGWSQSVKKVDELRKTASEMDQDLRTLLADPEQFRQSRLTQLESIKKFCLALSKRALAGEQSFEDSATRHPFRRITAARP